MTTVLIGQQATATSVGATASGPQDPLVVGRASSPTQPTPSSLPSDTTTAFGDSELGLDFASAALILDVDPDVKAKTSTTGENVTAAETSTLPSANQLSTASNVIVVEPRSTAASTVAPAGATQTQSTGSQPSVSPIVASGNTNTGVASSNVALTSGSILNPIPVTIPPLTNCLLFLLLYHPSTMGNFSVPPQSTYYSAGASTFAQVPISQVLSFAGVGPPYNTVAQVGGRSGLPPEQREGGYWSREEPDEHHGGPRVPGESRCNVEDRNDNFGHHRQGRPTGWRGPKTPEVRLPEFDGSVDWSEFDLHFNKVAGYFQWNDADKPQWLTLVLRGTAAVFCESLPEDTHSDYHHLRDALKDRFGNCYPRTVVWAMFSQLKQPEGESYEQFAARVRELAHQAEPLDGPGPSVYMQVNQFLRGCNDR